MTVDCVKYSPTGNVTVLVTSPVPRDRQAAVAAALLAPGSVGGEQVGYVERPADARAAARLQMMGGEFCGNATMALGAMLARDTDAELLLEVSGSEALVPCRVQRDGDGWTGTVRMPLPTDVREVALETDAGPLAAPLVEMPGIAHLILPADAAPGEAQLRRRLPEWNRQIGADALGALLWDEAASAIDPLVFVPSAGTLVREHGCGSGSAAVGFWLSERCGAGRITPVRQPGGVITVDVRRDGPAVTGLTITGRVTLIERRSIEL